MSREHIDFWPNGKWRTCDIVRSRTYASPMRGNAVEVRVPLEAIDHAVCGTTLREIGFYPDTPGKTVLIQAINCSFELRISGKGRCQLG